MTPCSDAMIKDILTVKPNQTVQEVLDIFEKNDIRSVPVVDDNGKLVGLFGLKHVLLGLLPKSVTMEGGLNTLDFVIGAAPGIAKRLEKLRPVAVSELMDANPHVMQEETPTWEALRIMAVYGSPVPVVKEKTGEFVGAISRKSLLSGLEHITDEVEE